MEANNAILFSNVDKEDYWVSSGIVFKTDAINHYEDAYNKLKDKIESDEVINHVVDKMCLDADLFDYDITFKFVRTYWKYGLFFVFENSEGIIKEHKMLADFVRIF